MEDFWGQLVGLAMELLFLLDYRPDFFTDITIRLSSMNVCILLNSTSFTSSTNGRFDVCCWNSKRNVPFRQETAKGLRAPVVQLRLF